MVIHLSSTILHQIREIEYTVERDVIETPNHLFSPMYHVPEGWYDPSFCCPLFSRRRNLAVDTVGACINAETCNSIATGKD
jgi:hypothetical protein